MVTEKMKPISQYKFYELGAKLHRVIARKTSLNASEMFVPLMDAQAALDNLLKGDPIPLDHARADGNTLLSKLGTVFDKHFIDPSTRQFRFPAKEDMIESHELTLLTSLVEKFETALAAELSRKAIYAVPKRGLFDSYDLAENADIQFSDEISARMPAGVRDDIRAAGRALAFGLGVAACFHLIRALEQVLSLYLEAVTGQASSHFKDIWKDGLARLKSQEKNSHVDQRIVTLMMEADARYRAPLVRAEDDINFNEAVIFFSMASSIITIVLDAAGNRKPMEPRYKALQEKVEQVLNENDIDESSDDDAHRGKSASA
jgi:hypothetical protein